LSIEHRDLPVVCRASDAIVFCDVSTLRIVKANEAFGTLLGREASDVVGQSFSELWETGKDHRGTARGLPADDLVSGLRTRIRHQDGSLIDVHVFGGEVDVDGRRTLVTVVRHDRKPPRAAPPFPIDEGGASPPPSSCAIDEGGASPPPSSSPTPSNSPDDRERELDKLQALGRLAGSIAHDFNNLLSIIVGCVDALEQTLPEDGRQREITGELASASERATTLIRQLVAFSRRQTLDLRTVNLNSVLRSMQSLLARLLGHGIELVLLLDHELPAVNVDVGQIEQAVMNLCTNARDAIDGVGEVVLATETVTVDSEEAGRDGRPQAGCWVCLSVIDLGRGMEPEVLARAFEPFFTTKDVGRGMGLGLATVHGIVTQSGGHVSIDSAPGKGTVVRVWLPAVPVDR
jgi:PAS domain S-box-containing protein